MGGTAAPAPAAARRDRHRGRPDARRRHGVRRRRDRQRAGPARHRSAEHRLALRADRPRSDVEPPPCDGPLVAGSTARLDRASSSARSTGGQSGTVDLVRSRASGADFRWLAYVATNRELGQYGQARRGDAGPGSARPAAAGRATDADGRPGLDARPAGGRHGAHRRRPGRPPRTTASRSSRARRRGAAAWPSTGRRSGRAFPQVRVARRRRRPRALARPARLLGLPRRRSSARSRGRVNGEAGGIEDEAIQGDDRGAA